MYDRTGSPRVGSPSGGTPERRPGGTGSADSAAAAEPHSSSGHDPAGLLESQGALIRQLQDRVHAAEQDRLYLERRLEQALSSSSWVLTRPLRSLSGWSRRVAHRGVPGPALTVAHVLLRLKESVRGRRARSGRPLSALSLRPGGTRPTAASESVAMARMRAFLASGARLALRTSPRPELTIVIVVFNRAELTLDCLRSLAEVAPASFELIVVDNASTDATPKVLERVDGIRVFRNARNLHLLLSVNGVLDQVRGSRLLLLNNDTQVLPGSIESAMRTLDSADDVGAVGGKVVHMDGTLQEAGCILWRDGTSVGYGAGDDPLASPYMFERDVDYCSAAFFLTPAALFRDLGGFCEDFRPAYYEDVDYCLRLRRRGLRVVYDPNATILHYESASAASAYEPLELTLAHRPVLMARHEEALARQQAPLAENLLEGRTATRGAARTLVVDDRVPHQWLGSGFPRARVLLRSLLRRGHQVTLLPTDVSDEDWSRVYADLPRRVEVALRVGTAGLGGFLRERRGYYDNLIVSRPHNMAHVAAIRSRSPELLAGTRVIYDAEAVYALRDATSTDHPSPHALEAELALARDADAVAAVSDAERRLLEGRAPGSVSVLGHAPVLRRSTPGWAPREGLLFVGAVHEDSSPNREALEWLAADVLPRVRAALGSGAHLTVVGLGGSRALRDADAEGLRFTGCIESVDAAYDGARVFVAPNRRGSGIPLKVLDAAANGVPVVATPLLADQLGWGEDELAIADDAGSFAERCVSLYLDAERWRRQREAALRRIETDWSEAAFEAQLDTLLARR